jgi:hypothetical protein
MIPVLSAKIDELKAGKEVAMLAESVQYYFGPKTLSPSHIRDLAELEKVIRIDWVRYIPASILQFS